MLKYYIYAYLRTDGTPYYIGKGTGKRAWMLTHTVPLPRDRSRIIIMERGLTEIGALALERRYIRWWGRKDIGTGNLRNMTDGGDGTSGRIISEERRKDMSIVATGVKHTLETKQKISIAQQGKTHTHETRQRISDANKGRKPSPETRQRMSASQKLKVISPERKAKQSATMRNKPYFMSIIATKKTYKRSSAVQWFPDLKPYFG